MTRALPFEAAFLLGSHAKEPGFVQFLVDSAEDGFRIEAPGDEDLSEDEWRETANMRVRILTNAWASYNARLVEMYAEEGDDSGSPAR